MNRRISSLSDASDALASYRHTACESVAFLAGASQMSRSRLSSLLNTRDGNWTLRTFLSVAHALGLTVYITDTPRSLDV